MAMSIFEFIRERQVEEEEAARSVLDEREGSYDGSDDEPGSERWWALRLLTKINTERHIVDQLEQSGSTSSVANSKPQISRASSAITATIALQYRYHPHYNPAWSEERWLDCLAG